MLPENLRKPGQTTGWTEILENIQFSLAETLGEATNRERTLEKTASAKVRKSLFSKPGQECLKQFEERLVRFHASFQQAGQRAGEVETYLNSGLEALNQWQTATESLRQRLANGEARFIK
ncbi:MAG TPA: hypothetical protein VGY77_08820 [Gemmataceae bacterium]|jgi:hypothetical protein|nr:hypothetical protein [Gemmataceae bacterium]